MSLLQLFKSRKYLQRIVVSFMLVVVILIVTSVFLYFNAQNKVFSMQHETDRKLLTQMNYNIENMNDIVKDLAVSLFNDDDLVALKSGSDFEESILKLDKLNRLVANSPYLHSIVFYNGTQQRYFSSLNHNMNTNQLQSSLDQYMQTHPAVPKLQLIPMKLDPGQDDVFDTFSFFIYDGSELNSAKGSVLVLNIKPGWLLDNVEALNAVTEREDDVIFVTDSEGNVLISNNRMLPEQEGMKDELLRRIAASDSVLDYFTYTYQSKKYMVSYLTRGLNNWQIIRLQDYDIVLENVSRMRWTAITVTLSVVAMTVLLSIFISIRLYKPVGNLFSLVRRHTSVPQQSHDELSAIAQSYNQLNDQLTRLKHDQASQLNVVKVYHIRSLIADSAGMSEEGYRQNIERYGMDIAAAGNFILALIKIDTAYGPLSQSRESALSLIDFAISNIGQEMLRKRYRCESVELKHDHLVFLISRDGDMELGELHRIIRDMQDTILMYYHIGFTATLSPVFGSYREITSHYSQTLRLSNYRLVLGKGAIIDSEKVQANEECEQLHIPQELERRLAESLKSGDRERIDDGIDKWMELVSKFSYENILSALLHMVTLLNNTLGEMNNHNVNPISVNLREMNRRILEKDTLEEIREVLTDFVRDVFDQRQSGREDKTRLIVDTIKEIIDNHFADPDLNVQKIADMLRMSHVYLGQVFKEQESATVIDYINQRRLTQAKLYLEQLDLTVAEITEKSGFGSESYFYRLFKRKYGATPKEYRLKHAMEHNR
ncbi:helix-turn-helix domain-containing protein [Cohnella fermenti]|uniref:Helix-turn-helix domain-containing protein n=1 Tax=Cohnella fermenti TaxID=2565925 RepID=A0A4S4BG15_9BACL|nr:helix-turn-helix domain-containing protein [Cohnella fermenti]THF73337.1 helix-turn-helix domain-containing protein [Cohnella fermenti]